MAHIWLRQSLKELGGKQEGGLTLRQLPPKWVCQAMNCDSVYLLQSNSMQRQINSLSMHPHCWLKIVKITLLNFTAVQA